MLPTERDGLRAARSYTHLMAPLDPSSQKDAVNRLTVHKDLTLRRKHWIELTDSSSLAMGVPSCSVLLMVKDPSPRLPATLVGLTVTHGAMFVVPKQCWCLPRFNQARERCGARSRHHSRRAGDRHDAAARRWPLPRERSK